MTNLAINPAIKYFFLFWNKVNFLNRLDAENVFIICINIKERYLSFI